MNTKPTFETPFERRGIVTPGLPILPHGTERHPIPGGGSRALPISKGDEITILDREGLQACELTFFAPDTSSNAAMLGAKSSGPPTGTIALLSTGDRTARRTLTALKAARFDLATAECTRTSGDTKPGDMSSFTAQCDGLLIAASIGGPMEPQEQNPPTELILYIRRETPGDPKAELAPPDPLADPICDINIQPGEAKSFEAKKGEYIQILDVKGRECSDFQAFSRRALDKGLEREIDPTTTRSLMGSLYPAPGIYSKYWSSDHEPLVEIVQDTCGRHDTFGLACTARYYDDLGYPGHVNCSDNMNADLAQFDINRAVAGPRSTSFSTPCSMTPTPSAWTIHGPVPVISSYSAL